MSFHIRDPLSNISFLIDTGAQFSILPAKSKDKQYASPLTLSTSINSTSIKIYKSTRLAVSLGLRRKFNWCFILADIENAIIGSDFLSHFDLSVLPLYRQIIDNSTNLTVQGGKLCASKCISVCLDKYTSITGSPFVKQEVSHGVTHCITTTGSPVFCRPRQLDSARLKQRCRRFLASEDERLAVCL